MTRDKTQATRMWEDFSMITTATKDGDTATSGTGRRETEDANDRLCRLPLAAASTPRPETDKERRTTARERQDALPSECYFG